MEQICKGFENGCMCLDCCTRELGNFAQALGFTILGTLAVACVVGFVCRNTKWMKAFMKWAF